MKVEKIYFDMDGVLADFDRGVRELCGIEPSDQEHQIAGEDDIMWTAIRDIEHFYDRLELMPGAKEMFDLLNTKYTGRCEILTGIPKERRGIETAGDDKISWVRRLLSKDIPIHVVYKEDKKNYCTGKGNILIDDYSRNINEWEKYGGTGILHRSADETIGILKELGILDP